ncbi:AbrB/MazE/SpoVT family DNA-binding domain-containing protein [Paenibacillus polymyxa]|uniref:Regulator n=1 Tax=Paenibacillus polymyxa (strain SC2) TaxID=886882 RepID=E3EFD3_PAEPS|nr:AbrB/MazE/SpoVT family DNA-binding domain-containing protein [Paenibacillus polymyxa]ADO55096.2 regulator [Paenibacillus polymyxa SC2]WPQ57920.1 AbrB/MazE/SpoVT family DNA-binding domain-containing protein [Paenibacillus polymyxa]
MKNTGMTRPLDTLGRIVIPKELRTSMGIQAGESLEFYLDVETGLLSMRKYIGVCCHICHSVQDLSYFRHSFLCKKCIQDLKGNIEDCPIPALAVKEAGDSEKSIKRSSSQHLVEHLRRLMREYPTAQQGEYAEWLGVSQSRISQLKKLL